MGNGYIYYSGPASNFPDPNTWASFSQLLDQNRPLMRYNASEQEISWIQEAIETIGHESNISVRVILSIVMQESGGNPRISTTNNGVRNPGLMQSHNGNSFDAKNPRESIFQMIRDGVQGTKYGDGLVQLYRKYGDYYEACRGYNSGQINKRDLNDPQGATASYVRDVANRLMGHQWDGM